MATKKPVAFWLAFLVSAGVQPALAQTPVLDAIPQTRLAEDLRCHLGVYNLVDGSALVLTGNNGDPRAFQYTLSDGRFGRLQEARVGSFTSINLSVELSACVSGRVRLTENGVTKSGKKLPLRESTIRFASDGVTLFGKLVLPPSGRTNFIAVWIEGSNNNPSTDDAVWQYELARRGIGVFTYDKRGTGSSGGEKSADFHIRARDSVAALGAVRRLAPKATRFGVIGASQGGWVAPLTATLTRLDFVVTAFALADGPIAQDQAIVQAQVKSAGLVNANWALREN